jgi:Tfp pilus assembly protein PilF
VNSDTPPAPKRNTHKKPEPPPKNIAQQEAEDLQVASFYMNDKNWRGAYGRAQDAVRLYDDDPDAHLALAEAARKLGKLDEAEKEYRRTLALDPVPKTRKAAERALKEMTGGS